MQMEQDKGCHSRLNKGLLTLAKITNLKQGFPEDYETSFEFPIQGARGKLTKKWQKCE